MKNDILEKNEETVRHTVVELFDMLKEKVAEVNHLTEMNQHYIGKMQEQQAKIDELKHQKSLQELAINQISQANQEWRSINYEQQKRIDDALNFYNYAKSDVNIGMIKMKQYLRGEK